MRLHADRDVCIGSGNCVLTAEDVFDQDDDATVLLLTDALSAEQERRVRATLSPGARREPSAWSRRRRLGGTGARVQPAVEQECDVVGEVDGLLPVVVTNSTPAVSSCVDTVS